MRPIMGLIGMDLGFVGNMNARTQVKPRFRFDCAGCAPALPRILRCPSGCLTAYTM